MSCLLVVLAFVTTFTTTLGARTFSLTNKTNVVAYWGQGDGGDPNLGSVCDDPSYDVIIISFITTLGNYKRPVLSSDYFSTSDIDHCHAKGKTLMISCGGGGNPLAFNSAADAENGAQQIWNIFLGGQSSNRPYGDFKFDGIDLDIESGNVNYWAEFTNELRRLYASDKSKTYFISSAPQCPFSDDQMGPDGTTWDGHPIHGSAITKGWMDFLNLQFYNNPQCEVLTSGFNFQRWSNALRAGQQNNNMKILLGLPGSRSAAGDGYVPADQIPVAHLKTFPNFLGVMFWDVQAAQQNNNFQKQVKKVLLDK